MHITPCHNAVTMGGYGSGAGIRDQGWMGEVLDVTGMVCDFRMRPGWD